jgi:transcriptional regulator with XRE-family HTH domain
MAEIKGITTYPALCGAILTNLRNDIGQTQIEIAEMAGVKRSTWSRIEKGESSLSVEQLFFAARALGVEATTIIDMIDKAVTELRAHGVRVERTDQQSNWNLAAIVGMGLLPVAGPALSLMIAGITAYASRDRGK